MRLNDHGRPQFGLCPDGEVWLPMVQKRSNKTDNIQRHELMDYISRQTPPHDSRRCHGACRNQNREVFALFADAADQLKKGKRLADRGRMKPDQWPIGPRLTGNTAPLIDTRRVLFAARQTARQNPFRQTRSMTRKQKIKPKQQGA